MNARTAVQTPAPTPPGEGELSPDARLLVQIVRETGIKPFTLGEKIGVRGSTLTRHMPDDEGRAKPDTPRSMHADTRLKLEQFLAAFRQGGGAPAAAGLAEDAAAFVLAPEPAQDPVSEAVRRLIGGRNGLVPYIIRSRAVEHEGYLPGDVVLLDLNNLSPQPGDVVCAQVYDWPSMTAETVIRAFEWAPPVSLLLARSSDPALRRPLVVDGERVVIKGVILPHRLRPAN